MLSLTVNSIKANKVRFVMTAIAVVLGVAFMAGTLVLTDTIKQSYDNVAVNVYKSTDAVVRSDRHLKNANGDEVRGTIDASLLATVRAAKGVQAAEPQQLGIAVVVAHDGKLLDANPNRSIPVAIAWQQQPKLNPMELVSGHAPRAPDEIVIDRASWKRGHYRLGETVRVLSQAGSQQYRLAGVATYGGADSAAGAQVVAFAPQTAARVLGTAGRYDAIQVVAAPGVSQHTVVANIEAALHASTNARDTEVITGAAATKAARDASDASLGFINVFLMSFAVVALFVGSFVIYNTFTITVAQRTKETALLRAIGARRKQVTRSVRLEALFTGVFASAVGVVAGIAMANGLRLVLKAFGLELPHAGLVVQPRTVVISMIVGVVVTVVAAFLPARKAAKVAPIEALRDVAVDGSARSVRRLVIGVIATLAGASLMISGLSGHNGGTVGLGSLCMFVGVIVLGPVLARPFTRLVGLPLPRTRGMAGTLARENASRNPRRTSATASALLIGVALVAFITVFAASGRASTGSDIDKAMRSDWIVETQFAMGGLSPAATQRIDALPETGTVTALRFVEPTVGGKTKDVTAFNPAHVEQTIDLGSVTGHLSDLHAGTVAMQAAEAETAGVKLGDTITMTFPETGPQRLRVVAEYTTKQPLGAYVISMATFDANVSAHVDDDVLVTNAPGVSSSAAHAAIEHALKDFPNATLMTRDQFKGSVAAQINQILDLIYVLLGMALVIALFGIANTLALSVFERTREFGLLRAVGMSRAQVRSSIRWESVLIALLGTTLGTALGVGIGSALIKASKGDVHQLSVPVKEIAVIVVLAAIAAVIAAAVPARRAARLDVLEAIRSE
ncbi:MAG TPA: FtsX-like permease family protein [Acidimicrobiia bacterium]|jgi:putative ABC transport system permease protein|nr:FtsX-like permease family protein [Acidimicrobiia bacterium]